MSSLLKNPKALLIMPAVLAVFLISLAGGALGNEFGGGFLASPIAHIQLPAESVFNDELFPGFTLTNTMVATWIAIAVLVAIALLARRGTGDVPTGIGNLVGGRDRGLLEPLRERGGPETPGVSFRWS